MTGAEELVRDNARKSMSRFFLNIGRKAREGWKDEYTGQLFGIAEYLRCDGLLAKDAAPRTGTKVEPNGRATASQDPVRDTEPSAAAYLAKCERAIAQAAREYRA